MKGREVVEEVVKEDCTEVGRVYKQASLLMSEEYRRAWGVYIAREAVVMPTTGRNDQR